VHYIPEHLRALPGNAEQKTETRPMVNPAMNQLNPYPFARLAALLDGHDHTGSLPMIPLSLGEPRHETPAFLIDALADRDNLIEGVGAYPLTGGLPELREAIAGFARRRFDLAELSPDNQVLPVNGSREALFAFAQSVLHTGSPSITMMPNPFYQIYEGAALLGGSEPHYIPCIATNCFNPDFSAVTSGQWSRCDLVFLCSPGNPTGAVMSEPELIELVRLADKHDFIIASDECYSEIWQEKAPAGLLGACARMNRHGYERCVVLNSLSKRSNLPGLRSGFVAGDATLISNFLLYRTYHGSAMPHHVQRVSAMAWNDETHVEANRDLYRRKFEAVIRILEDVLPVRQPDASFYLWPETPGDDQDFARQLWTDQHVKVIPGSFLGRHAAGGNPGSGRVRMALVATLAECVEAAERVRTFLS